MQGIRFCKEVFWGFYKDLNHRAQKKLEWTLGLVRDLPVIPSKYFKSIKGVNGLYEIRVKADNKALRIFCCLEKNNQIVLFNGFVKKSNKTPKREIHKAMNLRMEYYNEKED